MANEVSRAIIAKLPAPQSGPEYDEAVLTGAEYWRSVLDGSPDFVSKKRHDAALSKLTGRKTWVDAQPPKKWRRGLINQILRAFQ